MPQGTKNYIPKEDTIMKFLNEHTRILKGNHPIDMNDRDSEWMAVELDLPDNFSDKAKACWEYFEGAAFIFQYMSRLVVTDEGLYLTAHGDGSHDAPFGAPRWVCDSWEELERILEATYDELEADGLLPEQENEPTEAEQHIARLMNHGVRIKRPDGTTEDLTMDFYHRAMRYCNTEGCRAVCYEIELPGIEGEFMIAFWRDGRVDSGSTKRIFDCLAQ